jgi:hypothetical protein
MRFVVKILHLLKGDSRAVAAIEFAIAGPLFLLALIGFFDYCWQIYGKAVLEGAVAQSARNSTLEEFIDDPSALDERVRSQVRNIFKGADVRFSRAAFDSYEQIGKPESYTDASPKNGKYDKGECFDDLNRNGVWDSVSSGRTGNGGADDIVLYTAEVEYLRVLPIWRMLNQPQAVKMSASTILRNQPYAAGATLHNVVCK